VSTRREAREIPNVRRDVEAETLGPMKDPHIQKSTGAVKKVDLVGIEKKRGVSQLLSSFSSST